MNNTIQKVLSYPVSLIYQIATQLRNKLYDLNIIKNSYADIPTISVGNITVGGTGKTPHAEYIISLLKDKYKLAYLSRGYKRKSIGYQESGKQCSAMTIGDEAFQVHKKFPEITVAVDTDRFRAISHLSAKDPKPDIIVLDDCYQYRKLHPDINILLIDYNRLTYLDNYLPYGELRESKHNTDRANIVIITKCPKSINPADKLSIRTQLGLLAYQSLYFTCINYRKPKGVFTGQTLDITPDMELIVVSGISQPQHLHNYLREQCHTINTITYEDHHTYTQQDIKKINGIFEKMEDGKRAIIITEKDLSKIEQLNMPENIKNNLYSIGIEIDFMFNDKDNFDKKIDFLSGIITSSKRFNTINIM